MNEPADHPVRTTEKALRLIETLDTDEGFRLTELADRVEMSKSGVHNHLSTLREHGYVTKSGDEYSLSLKFLSLGGHVRSRSPLYRHGRAKVDQLAEDTGMLANLATEEGGRSTCTNRGAATRSVWLPTSGPGCRSTTSASARRSSRRSRGSALRPSSRSGGCPKRPKTPLPTARRCSRNSRRSASAATRPTTRSGPRG